MTFEEKAASHWEVKSKQSEADKRPLAMLQNGGRFVRNRSPIFPNKAGGIYAMEVIKFQASEVAFHIRHDLRELPNKKQYGNTSIDPALSSGNYSLIYRGKNASEVNQYRKNLEKEIFHYNRKNLVHAVEVVIQCPADCPPEQKEAFFQESYNYICSTLPMGEKCVFVAEVHTDEKHYAPDGTMISKDHLHLMYVPGVLDTKHDGYQYRLCADQLTKKAKFREMHPGLQKHLNEAGIHATVYRKKEGDGKTVSLSVKQLKELTAKTGITLDHSLTVDELVSIINSNILHEKQREIMQAELLSKEKKIAELENKVEHLEEKIRSSEPKAKEAAWGNDAGWGTASSGWGTNHTKKSEEFTW